MSSTLHPKVDAGEAIARRSLDDPRARGAGSAQSAVAGSAIAQLAAADAPLWLACAQALLRAGAMDAAVLVLEAASARWPARRELRLWQGNGRRLGGDTTAAEAVFRSLLADEPAYEEAAVSLATMLRERGRTVAAAEVIEGLWQRQNPDAQATLRCAGFLQECQAFEQAAAVCEAALEQGIADPRVSLLCGRMAMKLGRFDQARRRLLEAVQAGFEEATALMLLANAQRYTDAGHPDLDLLRRAWRKPWDGRARSAAGFGLGKALDDLGDYAAAAEVLRQANAAAAGDSRWDAAQWQRRVQGLLGQQPLRLPEPVVPDLVPVFVIGLPRTGTTLVADLLARHPQVRNRGEMNWLAFLHDRLESAGGLGNAEAMRQAAVTYLSFMRLDDAPAYWYIDKNPLNFRQLKLIDALFPNARIIHCRRNLRDTALSIWSHLFAHRDNDYSFQMSNISAFAAGYSGLMAEAARNLRVRIHDLQYEELVADPAGRLQRLADFLDLPAYDPFATEPAVLRPVTTASVWQVRQPIYRRGVGHWRAYAPYLPELTQAFPQSAEEHAP